MYHTRGYYNVYFFNFKDAYVNIKIRRVDRYFTIYDFPFFILQLVSVTDKFSFWAWDIYTHIDLLTFPLVFHMKVGSTSWLGKYIFYQRQLIRREKMTVNIPYGMVLYSSFAKLIVGINWLNSYFPL